jgi:transcription antitermination protein NusB
MKKQLILKPRTNSRMLAVQAMYQYFQTQSDYREIIQQFITSPIINEQEETIEWDKDFFKHLISNVIKNFDQINSSIENHLTQKWCLNRLSIVMNGLLQCATFELLFEKTTPNPVIIDQYVEISKGFFDTRDIAFVNAILDNIAKNN